MAYKPSNANSNKSNGTPGVALNGVAYKYPKLDESGSYSARISLIVDIGTQERADFEDPITKELTVRKPVQQLVVFADLVDEVVDYGGDIGEKQYRLMLNKNFKGDITGIDFNAVAPRDADGKIISGKLYTFHPTNLMTKLAKATGNDHILGVNDESNMDISALLGAAFQADIDVKKTESEKKDAEGNAIVYTNINFKQASKVPKKLVVDDLQVEPLILNHNNVTAENVKFIRGKVVEMMKKAPEYEGSALQKLLAEANDSAADDKSDDAPAAEAKEPAKKAPTTVKPKATPKAEKKAEAAPVDNGVDIEEEMPDFDGLEEPF